MQADQGKQNEIAPILTVNELQKVFTQNVAFSSNQQPNWIHGIGLKDMRLRDIILSFKLNSCFWLIIDCVVKKWRKNNEIIINKSPIESKKKSFGSKKLKIMEISKIFLFESRSILKAFKAGFANVFD